MTCGDEEVPGSHASARRGSDGPPGRYAGFSLSWLRTSRTRLYVTTADHMYARKCTSSRQLHRLSPKQRLRYEMAASIPARNLRSRP